MIPPNHALQRPDTGVPAAERGSFARVLIVLGCSTIAGFLFACASTPTSTSALLPALPRGEETAALVATLADPAFASAWGMREHPILLDETISNTEAGREDFGMVGGMSEDFFNEQTEVNFKVSPELLRALSDACLHPVRLEGLLTQPPLALVSARAFNSYFSKDGGQGWETFGKRFPGVTRIVRISAPGFSGDRSQALVAVERSAAAPCCSDGYVTFLQRTPNGWKVAGHGGWWST